MISIEDRKAVRRLNVGRLLDQIGQTKLAELTEISPALLYQFGKARGKSKRNVNDDHARAIEEALGYEAGWLDIDHSNSHETPEPTSKSSAPNARWPFGFAYARFDRLQKRQKSKIAEVVEGMVRAYEADNPAAKAKSRAARKAG